VNSDSTRRAWPPVESYPAEPSRPATASPHLSWASAPYSTFRNRGSTFHGLCLPASFRLQGLATLLTAYSPRSRAGFVSHRQRSWDSPFGAFSSRKVSSPFPGGRPHLLFRLTVYPAPRCGAGSTGRSSWGSAFRESLAAHMCLAHRLLDAPLGFTFQGSVTDTSTRISPGLLSRAFRPRLTLGSRRPRVSIGIRPTEPPAWVDHTV